MKEIKELNKWRDISCSWTGIQYCQDCIMSYNRFTSISITTPRKLFYGYIKTDSKVYMEKQKI